MRLLERRKRDGVEVICTCNIKFFNTVALSWTYILPSHVTYLLICLTIVVQRLNWSLETESPWNLFRYNQHIRKVYGYAGYNGRKAVRLPKMSPNYFTNIPPRDPQVRFGSRFSRSLQSQHLPSSIYQCALQSGRIPNWKFQCRRLMLGLLEVSWTY